MRDRPPTRATPRGAATPAAATLALIGAGRVGRSLAVAAERAGIDAAVSGREGALATAREAETALLCVPDAAITEACQTIADAIPPLGAVGHVSGATGLEALAPATTAGALTFSLHPLQTVPAGGADLTGVPAAIAGSSPAALELARDLAERLGMRPFEVAEEHRAAYHAAAAIASNYLVALQESAVALLAAAGVDDGRELLAPLVLATAANWSELGAEALTGPIARGDEATVERHLAALRERAPELVGLYEELAQRTREIARRERR